ncbi:MAG: phospholipase A [Chitinophagaceae bacterium]
MNPVKFTAQQIPTEDKGLTAILPVSILIALLLTAPAARSQQDDLFKKDAYRQTMCERWELDSGSRRKTFIITPYKPIYITAGRWSGSPNTQPKSGNPAYSLPFPVAYNNYEAKFQLSLKIKVLQAMFWGHGDLWIGYTQKAHWQIYNEKLSRPSAN